MHKLPKFAVLLTLWAAPVWADTKPIPLATDPTGGTLILVCQQTGTQVACIEGDGVGGGVSGDVSAGSWYATDAAIAAATPDLPAGQGYSWVAYENDTAGGVTPGGADDLKIVAYLDGFDWTGTVAYDRLADIHVFAVDMEPAIEDIQATTSFLPEVTAGDAGGLFIAGTNAATTVTTAFTTTFTGNLTGNVGGNVTGSVGSVAAGGLTASSVADGAIDAATFAADVDAEILSYIVDDATRIDASDLNTFNDDMEPLIEDVQADLANGGRLDLIFDATLADTNELQTDWANGGRLDLLVDATLADTNELQLDWVNGGRLDLIVDAILADTAFIGTPAGDSIADDIADLELATVQPISPDRINTARTWIANSSYRADNIVEVAAGFVGTFSVKPSLNPNTAIVSVSGVSITGAATVTATDLASTADRLYANFTVPALSTTGTYAVVVTVTTTDGQTIKTTATLKVY